MLIHLLIYGTHQHEEIRRMRVARARHKRRLRPASRGSGGTDASPPRRPSPTPRRPNPTATASGETPSAPTGPICVEMKMHIKIFCQMFMAGI